APWCGSASVRAPWHNRAFPAMALNALFLDFNSYFASVEQQERPELRGRPVAVAPVEAETTCCIASSHEARKYGVKTGTMIAEARRLCPGIEIVQARPHKYTEYHEKIEKLIESLIHIEAVCSIDEMWCQLTGRLRQREEAMALAHRIKQEIRATIGECMRCSIGIAPNPFLAKTATEMQKPDGLVVIDNEDLPHCLYKLKLRDLCGIGARTEQRLKLHGIRTVRALCEADAAHLRTAWGGVEGERMHANLRGAGGWREYEKDKTLGHSHVLAPEQRNPTDALAVLHRLLQKAATRLRTKKLVASGMMLTVHFARHGGAWHASARFPDTHDTMLFTAELLRLWKTRPEEMPPPLKIGVTFFHLRPAGAHTPDLFNHAPRRVPLNEGLDRLNKRYGYDTVFFGGAFGAQDAAPMRIAFGYIPDSENESDEGTDPVVKKGGAKKPPATKPEPFDQFDIDPVWDD
ncbi:MAG: DNA polymerase Y family protein, partial [Chthoniobacterales bacterium]